MDDVLSGITPVPQARWKIGLRLLVCLGFLAIAVALSREPKLGPRATYYMWAMLVLASPGALIFLAQLVRPGRLEISPRGLVERGLFRTRTWTWDAFCRFHMYRYRGTKRVVFDLARPPQPPNLLQRISRGMGHDGSLMMGLSISPERTAEQLNAALERWRPRR